MYKIFPLSLILRLDAIFTLARHVQLKIMPIPLFKTKCYQILVSKPLFFQGSVELLKNVSSKIGLGLTWLVRCENENCPLQITNVACVAGVWKGRERGFWARGKREGRARREGGRETPARKPLFSPSRLLIMYAKITQLWMTSCQISLATMRLFKSYFAYCFSFVFLKQEIWSEGNIKKSIKCGRLLKEESRNHAWLVI